MTSLAKECVESWKKHCPDYEIKRWDEESYDISKNAYMYEAYQSKMWGFVPDYARLDIVQKYGGFYLDTDVELIKSLEPLREYNAFVGQEAEGTVALGLGFGAVPNHSVISKMLKQYEKLNFINDDQTINLTSSPIYQTELLNSIGLKKSNDIQFLENGFAVLPVEYLNPIDLQTGKKKVTDNTISVHHYAASWTTKQNKRNKYISQRLTRLFGPLIVDKIKKIKHLIIS